MKPMITQPLVFEPIFMESVWGGRRLESLYGKKEQKAHEYQEARKAFYGPLPTITKKDLDTAAFELRAVNDEYLHQQERLKLREQNSTEQTSATNIKINELKAVEGQQRVERCRREFYEMADPHNVVEEDIDAHLKASTQRAK